MKFKFAAGVALALMLAQPLTAAADEAFTPAQKTELGAFIKDYLVTHPDVLRDAIDRSTSTTNRSPRRRGRRRSPRASAMFRSKFQAVVGNPKGGATLVEFFDYNCHFCKGALPDIARLMKDDPDLKSS